MKKVNDNEKVTMGCFGTTVSGLKSLACSLDFVFKHYLCRNKKISNCLWLFRFVCLYDNCFTYKHVSVLKLVKKAQEPYPKIYKYAGNSH